MTPPNLPRHGAHALGTAMPARDGAGYSARQPTAGDPLDWLADVPTERDDDLDDETADEPREDDDR